MNIKESIKNYIRVLKITRKPTKEEFSSSSKITGIGMLLIGFIGFLIYIIATALR